MSFDHILVPVWRLGQDGHIGRVVKITAPDESWTIVGTLDWSQVKVAFTMYPGTDQAPDDFEGSVELRVGPWKGFVPGNSSAIVEVPRKALPWPEDEAPVLEGKIIPELEWRKPVSRETDPCICLHKARSFPYANTHDPDCPHHEHEDCCK